MEDVRAFKLISYGSLFWFLGLAFVAYVMG